MLHLTVFSRVAEQSLLPLLIIRFKMHLLKKLYVLLKVNCEGQPWVITPTEARFLYVQLRGHLIPGARGLEPNVTQPGGRSHCPTKNRVRVHAGGGVDVLVCPLPAESGRHPMVREVAARQPCQAC